MTITQTVDIPADRRVFFEFLAPREIPAGKTRVEMKLTPVVEKQAAQRSPDRRSPDRRSPDRRSPDRRSPDRRSETALKSADEGTTPHPHADTLKRILSQPTPRADALSGILSGLGDITLEQIREERLAKYL